MAEHARVEEFHMTQKLVYYILQLGMAKAVGSLMPDFEATNARVWYH